MCDCRPPLPLLSSCDGMQELKIRVEPPDGFMLRRTFVPLPCCPKRKWGQSLLRVLREYIFFHSPWCLYPITNNSHSWVVHLLSMPSPVVYCMEKLWRISLQEPCYWLCLADSSSCKPGGGDAMVVVVVVWDSQTQTALCVRRPVSFFPSSLPGIAGDFLSPPGDGQLSLPWLSGRIPSAYVTPFTPFFFYSLS